MVGLFLPLGQLIPGVLDPLQVKANCGLHSAAKEIEKHVLAISVVAHHLTAFDSSWY